MKRIRCPYIVTSHLFHPLNPLLMSAFDRMKQPCNFNTIKAFFMSVLEPV